MSGVAIVPRNINDREEICWTWQMPWFMLLGAMLFFPSVVAPVVFTSLPETQAGLFLRAMFPRYYGFMIVLSLVSAALFAVGDKSCHFARFGMRLCRAVDTVGEGVVIAAHQCSRDAQLAGDVEPVAVLMELTSSLSESTYCN